MLRACTCNCTCFFIQATYSKSGNFTVCPSILTSPTYLFTLNATRPIKCYRLYNNG